MFEHLPEFQELRPVMAHIVESGYADNILDAYRLALHHKASVQKAKKAAPVKSSSGYSAKGGGDSSLDAVISGALSGWGE